jgi:hypothetical protein
VIDALESVLPFQLTETRDVLRDRVYLLLGQAAERRHLSDAVADRLRDPFRIGLQLVERRPDFAAGTGVLQRVADRAGRRGALVEQLLAERIVGGVRLRVRADTERGDSPAVEHTVRVSNRYGRAVGGRSVSEPSANVFAPAVDVCVSDSATMLIATRES